MRCSLEVRGSLAIHAPAGRALLTGRGPSLNLDLERAPSIAGWATAARRGRRSLVRLAEGLRFAGLTLEVRIGGRRIARLGHAARGSRLLRPWGGPEVAWGNLARAALGF